MQAEGYTKQNLTDIKGYLFVDLETGGLDPTLNPILQIAAIVTDLNFNIRSHWMSYVKPIDPKLVIEEGALKVNGLTKEKIDRYGADEVSVASTFVAFASCYPRLQFAGYKCSFDVSFVAALLERCELYTPFIIPWFDILEIARKKLGRATLDHKLVTVAKHFGYDTTNAHDALTDIHTTIKVARRLIKL